MKKSMIHTDIAKFFELANVSPARNHSYFQKGISEPTGVIPVLAYRYVKGKKTHVSTRYFWKGGGNTEIIETYSVY